MCRIGTNFSRAVGNWYQFFSVKFAKTEICSSTTLSIRHHNETVPKIHIDASVWILASSCDCANMDSVKWEILPSANGNFTRNVKIYSY